MAAVPARRRSESKTKRGKKSNDWLDDDTSIRGWGNEVAAVLVFSFGSYLGISVIASFFAFDTLLLSLGAIGVSLAEFLTHFFGLAGMVPVLWLGWIAVALWQLDERPDGLSVRSIASPLLGLTVVLIAVCASFSLLSPDFSGPGVTHQGLGGVAGTVIGTPLKRVLGSFGVTLLIATLLVSGLSLALKKSVGELLTLSTYGIKTGTLFLIGALYSAVHTARLLWTGFTLGWNDAFSGPMTVASLETVLPKPRNLPKEKNNDREKKESQSVTEQIAYVAPSRVYEHPTANHHTGAFELGFDFTPVSTGSNGKNGDSNSPNISSKKRKSKADGVLADAIEVEETIENSDSDDSQSDDEESDAIDSEEFFSHVVVSRRVNNSADDDSVNVDSTPDAVINSKESRRAKQKKIVDDTPDFSGYQRPSFSLLTKSEDVLQSEDDDELIQKSRQIELKLRDFNIQGRVTEVHPGPVITLFEFEPAAGVKVGKIAALQDDLAMSLRASSIRIIAPIPKKGTVGIEVPNKHRDIVRLRDVLEAGEAQLAESILAVPIGKDTYGDPVVVDIATMPHLLMAGATGTGKSVSINALLVSLLYRASPADLGLILIDPKILELSTYDGIPHLKVPVVTVPKQAKAVLDWAVKEMDRRYRVMQKYGVRNIDGYNAVINGKVEENAAASAAASMDSSSAAFVEDIIPLSDSEIIEEGTVVPSDPIEDAANRAAAMEASLAKDDEPVRIVEELKPLPKIVIVIDELADLMLTVGRDIEELITRLAQKARAAGIHLILATQRPSVDVITGLIKANFPARLSFRVTSRIDSRTILDSMGAERLLGKGDMLFMQPGAQHLKRVHGAFVSDAEVIRVVDAVKKQASPCYDQKIIDLCEKALKEDAEGGGGTGSDSDGGASAEDMDPLYDKAVELVVLKGQASTSMVQRVFRIGYNRAARIIELMEKEGVIGPMDGIKPREVLVQEVPRD